jgi:hypothetical protein
MIIRPATLGISTSVDSIASALRATLRPHAFVPARRDESADSAPVKVAVTANQALREAA